MPRGSFARRLALFALLAVGAVLLLFVAGCGGGAGSGGMMQAGPGMMGYAPGNNEGAVRSLTAARRRADRFGEALALQAGEVMRFSNGFYAELLDADGRRGTEVLIDPGSGAVWIEYGPAMMWNTRYGMMSDHSVRGGPMMGGGMMGGGMMTGGGMMSAGGMMAAPRGGWGMMGGRFRGDPTWTPYGRGTRKRAISAARAEQLADGWLAQNAPGLRAGEADAFPGYYTLHALRDGAVAGMLSVNAYTGAVWYHWWHGRFLRMSD
jgi:hypothetical protein